MVYMKKGRLPKQRFGRRIHTLLRAGYDKSSEGSLDGLFSDEHIESMRAHGEYLTPGKGMWKTASTLLLLLVAVVISWFMSILSPLIVIGMFYFAYGILASLTGCQPIRRSG